MKGNTKYTFVMLFAAALWGFAFVAQVYGMEHLETFTFNASRFILGAAVLVPVVLILERKKGSKQEKKKLLAASLLGGFALFFASALQQTGIKFTGSAGVSGFITSLYMLLVPLASYLLFKQKTTLKVLFGALLAFLGVFLLCYKPGEGVSLGIGELVLFCGTLFWTAHVIIVDVFVKDVPPLKFSAGQFAVCGVLNLICALIFETPTLQGLADGIIPILYCGILSVGVAYTCQVIAQKNVEASRAVIVLSTESLFSAIGGAIFGVDDISLIGYIGCALIFCGVLISQIDVRALLVSKKHKIEK